MENLILEKNIKGAIKPLSIEIIKKITYQMENCVCKIYKKNETASGFFIKINYQSKMLPILMTNNHVITEQEIKKNIIITLSLNNGMVLREIKLDDSRLIFTDQELDITIVEIKENEDEIHNFLEIDDKLNNDINSFNNIYSHVEIYLLNYPKDKNIVASCGFIKSIEKEYIMHKCSTETGSSGSPILLLNNCKVIGIHCAGAIDDNKNYNKGILINYCITKLNKTNPIYRKREEKTKDIIKIEENNLEVKKEENSKNNNFKEKINKERCITENINKDQKIKENKEKENVIEENKLNNLNKDNIIKEKEQKVYILQVNKNNQKKSNIETIKDIKKINKMTIKYNIKNDDKSIKLFGNQFIDKNKYNCKIIIEGKEQNICERIFLNEEMRNKKILTVELIETKTITDMSYLFGGDYFDGCESLISVENAENWDMINVSNLNHMFNNCKLLSFLSGISEWNTINVTDMNTMFSNCKSLTVLPDISNWDTSKVTNMAYMFQECSSLTYLPDISGWNINRVTNMKSMFDGCKGTLNIPVKFKSSQDCLIF